MSKITNIGAPTTSSAPVSVAIEEPAIEAEEPEVVVNTEDADDADLNA